MFTMPAMPGYADHQFSPATFFSGAGATVLFATGAMSYYAGPDSDYRVPGLMAEPGNVTLLTDLRTQVAALSLVGTGMLYARGFQMAAGILSGLGAAAVMSTVASEGQRWAESGSYFGVNLPALPQLPGEAADIAAIAGSPELEIVGTVDELVAV